MHVLEDAVPLGARKLVDGVDGALRVIGAELAPGREQSRGEVGDRSAGRLAESEGRLLVKLKNGGARVWGTVPMPAQAQLNDADARKVVEWILDGAQ